MQRTTFRLSALTFLVTAFLGACTLISEVDRSKIAEEEPVPGGMGGVNDGTGGDNDGTGGDGMGGDGGAGDGGAGGAN